MITKRLFLGIPLEENISSDLLGFQHLHKNNHPIRWVLKHNLHITVYFIGDFPKSHIDDLIYKIDHVLSQTKVFHLVFNTFILTPKRKPYMIWAKYESNNEFINLVKQIASIHDNPKLLNPKPHITLARYNPNKIAPILQDCKPAKTVCVNNIILYESILKPSGAEYIIVKKINLI